ncbi:MAG: threonine/serine exporter family protein [Streptosporangiales bacterium]|nr:threonine/serine exporter family protein [Streptosporangiales bacterium]
MTLTDRKIFPHEPPGPQRLALRARSALTSIRGPRKPEARHVEAPEIRAAYRILNFALRAGGALLSAGATTIEVEALILDLTAACGLDQCEADVTFTSMTASYIRGDDVEPVTVVRVVRQRSVDYGRLSAITALRDDLEAGRVTAEDAIVRLDQVCAAHPRHQTLVLLSWAGMATAFTVLLGGRWLAAITAFVSAAIVTLLMRAVARYGIPDFFQSALGAAVATGIAMSVVAAHVHVQPPLVVAGGIMVLVPGYSLVASVRDAITGFPISGSARGLEVLLTVAGIVTGVAATLYVAVSVGVVPRLGALSAAPLTQSAVQVTAAGVAAALYATAALVPRRSLVYSGLVGAGGWAVFLILGHYQASLVVSTAAASVMVGIAGAALGRWRKTHAFLYVVPGVMPLVPGLTIYQGMLDLFTSTGNAFEMLLRAVAVGLTIAAGVTLGEMIVRPVRRRRQTTDQQIVDQETRTDPRLTDTGSMPVID